MGVAFINVVPKDNDPWLYLIDAYYRQIGITKIILDFTISIALYINLYFI